MENYFHLTRERDSSKFEEDNIRPEMQPDVKIRSSWLCQNYSLRWKATLVRWARVKWRYWPVAQHHWWTQPRNCAPRSQVEVLRLTSIRKSLSFDDQCQRSACQIQPNGKNLFGTPKRSERLHLRPWFYKYFCGEVFVDQIGVLSISTLLTISTPYITYVFFQTRKCLHTERYVQIWPQCSSWKELPI